VSVVEIRRARPDDATAIVAMSRDVQALHVAARPDIFRPGGGADLDDVAARLADPDEHRYWVATLGGDVVGYAYARLEEEPESRWKWAARVLSLVELGVADAHRGLGAGRQLWDAVRAAAVDAGADRVIVNVWAFNDAARRFYERVGFAPFHTRMALELRAPERP
jgi:diamine N-acetyltransferase